MHVALAAAATGARLVHVSSDAVFSGAAPSYDERSQPDPVTPYGAAKAAAETAVKGITPAAVIARTSLIIGDGDSPQERLVHALASGAAPGALYTDDVRCPVHVTDLAAALLELAAAPHAGVCHVAGADAVSRYELGLLIAARDGLDQAALRPGQRAAAGTRALSTCGWTAPRPRRGYHPASRRARVPRACTSLTKRGCGASYPADDWLGSGTRRITGKSCNYRR